MRHSPSRASYCASLLFLIFLFGLSAARGQDAFSGRVLEVLSGDEMRVRLDTFEVIVHLHGVTAPLSPPRLKERARQYVARRVADTTVRVEVRGTGARKLIFGEVLPVNPNPGSLNQEIVRVGLATWARDYAPRRDDLARWEQTARAAKRGLWGDVSGENVPLPPAASQGTGNREQGTGNSGSDRRPASATKPQLRPSPPPPSAPTPNAVRNRVTATQSPISRSRERRPITQSPNHPTPNTQHPTPNTLSWERRFQEIRAYLRSAYAPPAPSKAFRPLWLTLLTGFAIAGGAGFVFLFGAGRRKAGSLPFQILCAAFIGAAGACLLPLPLLLTMRYLPYTRDAAMVAACLPLGVWLWRKGISLFRRDQILRATPRYRIADAPHGLVRISGEASAPNGIVRSFSAKLPAIYLREVTYRYSPRMDAKYDRRRNSLPHRWELLRDEVKSANFVIEDESGAVTVLADRAEFHPLRVARYYNDVPVEQFPSPPYGGDTKTHLYFLPERAEVTAWGRRHQSASPVPGQTEERMGYDAVSDCLIIAEGTPSRLYTRRPLWGMLLILLALTAFGMVAYCLLTPADLPPIRLTVSQYVSQHWKEFWK